MGWVVVFCKSCSLKKFSERDDVRDELSCEEKIGEKEEEKESSVVAHLRVRDGRGRGEDGDNKYQQGQQKMRSEMMRRKIQYRCSTRTGQNYKWIFGGCIF